LSGGCVEMHWTGKVRAVLIERDEFIVTQAQKDAWIAPRRIAKELVATHSQLFHARNRHGNGGIRPSALPELAGRRSKRADQEGNRCQAEKLRELASCDVAVFFGGNRKVLLPASICPVRHAAPSIYITEPDRSSAPVDPP